MPHTRCSDRLLLDDRAVQLLRVQDESRRQDRLEKHTISGFVSATKIKRCKSFFSLLKFLERKKTRSPRVIESLIILHIHKECNVM